MALKVIFLKKEENIAMNAGYHSRPQLWDGLCSRVNFIKNTIADLRLSKDTQIKQIEILRAELAKAHGEICQLRSDIQQVKEENRQFKERANELRASLQAAHSAVEKKQKMEGRQTVQFNLPEDEKFPNETLCHLFAILHAKLKDAPKKSNSPLNRESDVVRDFISVNPEAEKIFQQKKAEITELMNYAKKDEYLRSPKAQKILDVKECGHEFRPRDAFLKQKWIFHSKPLLFSVLYCIFVEIL